MNFHERAKEMWRNAEIQEMAIRGTSIVFATITVFSTLFIAFHSQLFATITPEQEWIPLVIIASRVMLDTCWVKQVIDGTEFLAGMKKNLEIPEDPTIWQMIKKSEAETTLQYIDPPTSTNVVVRASAHLDDYMFYDLCMAGILEEMVFRCFLISLMREIIGCPIWLSGGISMTAFALIHLQGKRFYIFLVSALFLFAYLVSGTSLSIFVHLLFNLTVNLSNIEPHIWVTVILQAFLMWCLGV